MLTLKEVQQFFEEQKAAPEVVEYLGGIRKAAVTPETVANFLDTTEDGKKLLQPKLDSYFTKGHETWMSKTFPTLLETEIAKRFPAETKEQKEIRSLNEKLATETRERIKATLQSSAISFLTSKSMPVELATFAVTDDEAQTQANLAALEKTWNTGVQALVEAKFKEHGIDPAKRQQTPPNLDEEIAKAEAAGDWKKAIMLKNQKAAKQRTA